MSSRSCSACLRLDDQQRCAGRDARGLAVLQQYRLTLRRDARRRGSKRRGRTWPIAGARGWH